MYKYGVVIKDVNDAVLSELTIKGMDSFIYQVVHHCNQYEVNFGPACFPRIRNIKDGIGIVCNKWNEKIALFETKKSARMYLYMLLDGKLFDIKCKIDRKLNKIRNK